VSKYGNKREEVDNITFHSRKEAKRYRELKLLLDQGLIGDLLLQVKYPLVVNGMKIATYIADFGYVDRRSGGPVIEDVKGYKTPMYNLKKKLVKAIYGIDILET
jgi:hypothetical protein